MQTDMNLQDFQSFLKKHRIGITDDALLQTIKSAFQLSDMVQIKRILDSFPELQGYVDYLSSNQPRLTQEDYQKLPDEELVRRQDLMGIPYGLINPVEVEIPIMQLIIDIAGMGNFDKSTLLDIGCANGHRLSFFASREIAKSKCVGVDFSDLSLTKAKEITEIEQVKVDFKKASCQELPFSSESIGWVWMIDTLPWVKEWKVSLKEVGRVLQNEGLVLLIYNPCPPRIIIDPSEAIQVLAEFNVKANTIRSRGLNSVFILGKKC